MGKHTARAILTGLLVFLVGCDRATKAVAMESLAPGKVVTLIRGVLDLRYTENFDTAFSLTRGLPSPYKPFLLTAVALVATLALAVAAYERRKRASSLEVLGFTLALAGALGNVLDRLARGYVVDFIHLSHWPVFNVADVLVVVGVVVMVRGFTRIRPAPSPSPPA
jgi:signal peptidase II